MKRTPGLILFCLLTHAATVNELLRCPKSRVEAAVGEDVILEFHIDPERDVTAGVFKLMFNQSDFVLAYRDGNVSDDQALQFKDRAFLVDSGNLSKGKFVVKISPLNTTDAGKYTCTAGKGSRQISCSFDLIIDRKENSTKGNQIDGEPKENRIPGNPTDNGGGDHNNTYIIVIVVGIGIITGIVSVIVIVVGTIIVIGIGVVIAVMKCRRRKCKSVFCLRKIILHQCCKKKNLTNQETEENNQNDEGTDSNAVERIPLRTLAVSNE